MFSLGEIESNCTKAARGAGLSWGVAQECGLVARHLTELGLPGADAVFFNLKFINENHIRTIDLNFETVPESDKPIPGVLLGIVLVDQVFKYSGEEVKIEQSVIGPLGLLGVFIRLLPEKFCVSVRWSNMRISLGTSGLLMTGNNMNPHRAPTINFRVQKSSRRLLLPSPVKKRLTAENWINLTKLAQQTYVPSSERSRLFGAGGQEDDND